MALNNSIEAASERPSFFDLSPEIRNDIYARVVVVDHPVVIRQHRKQDRCWLFIVTPENDEFIQQAALYNRTIPEACSFLGVALLSTSKALRHEVLPLILNKNHVVFWVGSSAYGLELFTKHFEGFYTWLRKLTIHMSVPNDELPEWSLESLRKFSRNATKLIDLSCVVVWPSSLEQSVGVTEPDELSLNYFRPLSRLPLERANVRICYQIEMDSLRDTIRCQRAEAILLRDCNEEEEEQVTEEHVMQQMTSDCVEDDSRGLVAMGL